MADTWPAGLPQSVNVAGYSEGFADNLIRAKVDTGPAKVRRRSTAVPRPIKCEMDITRAQLATLHIFVDITLVGGSLPFNFPAPSESATWLVRFADGGLPNVASYGGNWFKVSFGLEVLP